MDVQEETQHTLRNKHSVKVEENGIHDFLRLGEE
jgi:hypothetical protein